MRLPAVLVLAVSCAYSAVEFNRDVRPILSDKCFTCHGADAKTKGIPLRLDIEAEAKTRAIKEGDPDGSPLIQRVTAEKAAMRMPPAHTGNKLSASEVATLRQWIAEGAKWQKHWSLIPPVRPALPKVSAPNWVANPIDAWVMARLDREELKPSREASRETLLRRVSLDLTGLPPTPAEIDVFLADRSPKAYENAVNRLLDSPRYGERMAARWLDAARYADTNGYQFDGERFMWRWRDWVIDSFNRNQRFDRFVLEQIAGDMLPGAGLDAKIATGFSRNHRGNTEDGIVPEEYAVEYVVDRVETTSTVFLGLTLGCTRCHNHKYDPFTQKEFYRLFAYFNNVPENGRAMKYGNSPPVVAAPTREQQVAHDELTREITETERYLKRNEAAIVKTRKAWLPAGTWWPMSGLDAFFTFEQAEGTAEGLFGKAAAFDGKRSVDFPGVAQFDIDDAFTISAWIDGTTGAIFSRMADRAQGTGIGLYLKDGRLHAHLTSNYVNDALRVDTDEKLAPGWHHVAMSYDGSVQSAGLKLYLDGKLVRNKVEMETLYRPFRNAGRAFKEPFRIGAGGGTENRFRGRIDQVLVYSRVVGAEEIAMLAIGKPLEQLSGTSEAERKLLDQAYFASAAPREIHEAWQRMQSAIREREKLERSFPTVMVMAESPAAKETHLLIRGAYDKPGEVVQPGVPAALPPLPVGAPNNRLGFAQWLVDPGHPLLARVTVNRFWQMYFGTGLVKTTEDFGQQGEYPSHPELLDWLATEFVQSGWNVKALQRLIVTSATYRQSSRTTPELQQRDPENRLLARGARFRMPAEMIRDQALLASGLLSEKLGGPSVKPYQPGGLWGELAMQDMFYVQSKGSELHRRSLYTFWKRTIAPPMMVNFDAANREACVVRENRTNTPLQALNLMNDVTFLEAARKIGERMIAEGGADPDSRIQHGFRLVVGRAPSDAERDVMRGSLAYHRDYFADEAKAKQFLAQGEAETSSRIEPRELAAYASVASMLLNLDEALTKE
ncbi:MAG: DUF1553 domain-containing protein [Bryobacteraceae bacterium]